MPYNPKRNTGLVLLVFSGLISAPWQSRATETIQMTKEQVPPIAQENKIPDGKGRGINAPPWAPKPWLGAPGSTTGISYHGGPLILGNTNIYYIWYGNWATDSAQTVLTDFAKSLGGSRYYNINTTYYDKNNTHVSNLVTYAGSTSDAYSRGTALSDGDIQATVSDAINFGRLPKDINGVYFVLTSADVTATSGFCTQYCGWHNHGTIAGSDIKYSFVGNPARCPSSCETQQTGPNGSGGADGMANIIAHELEEAVTDPDLNAWYDKRGYENADKCAWTFGATYTASNGALANMKLGARDYLIQQNWVNAKSGNCALGY